MRRSVSCWLFCGPLVDLVAPKRDRNVHGRNFTKRTDIFWQIRCMQLNCFWTSFGKTSAQGHPRLEKFLPTELTAFLPPRMFESMVIHCFGATSREICLVNQFATNFSLSLCCLTTEMEPLTKASS